MDRIDTLAAQASAANGIATDDIKIMAERGERRIFEPETQLFHESTPRLWLGIIEAGEVEIAHGLHGAPTRLGRLGAGSFIGEGALLDAAAHATSAFTHQGATVLTIPRAALDDLREARPDVYYRIVARVAQQISERLRHASEQISNPADLTMPLGNMRREHDLLGDRDLPNHVYYGVQTLRALENFSISGIPLKNYTHFIDAFAFVKKAAALANHELGVLAKDKMAAICAACDEIVAGKLRDQFVVDMIQGGAGTSTNMNVNEVIANRALELMGHQKGEYAFLHPNDDVNCSQSTNDAYPTAIKLGAILSLNDTLAAMVELKLAIEAKAHEFADVIKMGRTQLQDAVPMTLGQEFAAYAVMVGKAMQSLRQAADELLEIGMGATAIGTGINSPPGYADLVTMRLAQVSGLPVRLALDLVEATQDSGSFVQMSGAMKRAAVQISKICNDLRLLSSGPRCGLYEIQLPPMQPGSTIMPGKVNPVIPEVVNQVCFQIIGYDMTITMAAEASQLELNMAEPIIAFDLLFGLMILKNACITLTNRCIVGIVANREQCRAYVEHSIGLVTALNPVLGYERSAAIAKEALETGGSVYQLVLEKGWLSKDALDDMLKPENMTHPRQVTR